MPKILRSKLAIPLMLAFAALAIVPVFLAFTVTDDVDSWRAHRHGVHGTLTITSCEFHEQRRLSGWWTCEGEFLADDRSIRIRPARLINDDVLHETGDKVATLVSGPETDHAYFAADPTWWVDRMLLTVLLAGLLGFAAWFVWFVLWRMPWNGSGEHQSDESPARGE